MHLVCLLFSAQSHCSWCLSHRLWQAEQDHSPPDKTDDNVIFDQVRAEGPAMYHVILWPQLHSRSR